MIYIYIFIYIFIYIYISYFEIYIMEKHIHFFSPQFQASAQLLLQSGPLSEAQAPPRRRAAATDGHRHPQCQVALIRQTLGDRAEGPGGGGGVKGSCMVPGPKNLAFLMIFLYMLLASNDSCDLLWFHTLKKHCTSPWFVSQANTCLAPACHQQKWDVASIGRGSCNEEFRHLLAAFQIFWS